MYSISTYTLLQGLEHFLSNPPLEIDYTAYLLHFDNVASGLQRGSLRIIFDRAGQGRTTKQIDHPYLRISGFRREKWGLEGWYWTGGNYTIIIYCKSRSPLDAVRELLQMVTPPPSPFFFVDVDLNSSLLNRGVGGRKVVRPVYVRIDGLLRRIMLFTRYPFRHGEKSMRKRFIVQFWSSSPRFTLLIRSTRWMIISKATSIKIGGIRKSKVY